MSRSFEIRDSVSMWEALDIVELDYFQDASGDAFVHSWTREENTASVHVSDRLWYDFGSGEGGGVIEFVMSYLNCKFGYALAVLERQAGANEMSVHHRDVVKKPPPKILNFAERVTNESNETLGEYLVMTLRQRHGISPEIARQWDLREGPGNALWIPHWKGRGCSMVKYRDYRADIRRNLKGSIATGLYRRPFTVYRQGGPWALCEGESDSWAASSMSREYDIVGLPTGAGRWEQEWFDGLDLSKGISIMDNDPAGNKAANLLNVQLGLNAMVVPDPYNDLGELLLAGGQFSDLEVR